MQPRLSRSLLFAVCCTFSSGCAATVVHNDSAAMPSIGGDFPMETSGAGEEEAGTPPVAADALLAGQTYRALQAANEDGIRATLHGTFVRYDRTDPSQPKAVFDQAVLEHPPSTFTDGPPVLNRIPYVSRLFKTKMMELHARYEPVYGTISVPLAEMPRITAVPSDEAVHAETRETPDGKDTRLVSVRVLRGDKPITEQIGVDFDFAIGE